MRSRRRHVAAIAAIAHGPAASGAGLVGAGRPARLRQRRSALKGDWRPIGDSDRDPSLVQVACDPDASLEDCARQQGTYQADVFLRIGSSAGGTLRMISDGAVDATVATVAAKPTGSHDTTSARTFAVKLADGGTAKLVFGGSNGHCAAPESLGSLCFDIVGAPTGATLVERHLRGGGAAHAARAHPDARRCLRRPAANFLSMLTCADITRMDPDDLRYRGCTSPIFLSPNEIPFAGSKRYDFAYFADHNYVIPFGWQFADRSGGVGGESSKIIETGQDLTESQSSSLGVNASVNLYFVTASVKHNTKTESRVENMYDNALTYSQFSYLQTQFALVLDKENVGLDPYFIADALNLATAAKPDYSWFIGRWGTHYVHAATFGETGKLFSTYTKSDVEQLHESGVDVSTAVEAGVSYMGMGASVGVDVDNAKSQLAKMRQTLGNDFGAFQCSGGVTCDGKTASAGNTRRSCSTSGRSPISSGRRSSRTSPSTGCWRCEGARRRHRRLCLQAGGRRRREVGGVRADHRVDGPAADPGNYGAAVDHADARRRDPDLQLST
ncbi:MAG: MAC/perforin domain-containing protein [Amaricoccus sp.]